MAGKPIVWPDGNRVAVMITVEVDAEFIWLSLDPTNISRPKTLSMGQYGPARGLERVLDCFDCFGIKATFFVPGRVAELYPDKILNVAKRGHELGNHGYEHENFGLLNKEQQAEALLKGSNALERLCGVRPRGFRLPEGEMTPATRALLQEMGFQYSSTMHDDDHPYFVEIDRQATDLVEIPTHLELQDFPYFAFNFHPPFPAGAGRIANYNKVLSLWQDEFDGYYQYGLNYAIKFDPQIIGTPGRIALLEKLLAYIQSKGNVWHCTGSELAEYWRTRVTADQARRGKLIIYPEPTEDEED